MHVFQSKLEGPWRFLSSHVSGFHSEAHVAFGYLWRVTAAKSQALSLAYVQGSTLSLGDAQCIN